MDKRHVYGIMIDTETVNGFDDPFAYDIGYEIIDSYGRVYEKRSFVNADVFYGMPELMEGAFFKDKIPQYKEDLKNGKRVLSNTYKIKKQIDRDCKYYNCKFICAHNMRFDYHTLQGTQRYITKSKYRYFIPYGLEIWDTLQMARDVIAPMKTYQSFCEKNGYMTKQKKPQLTAEVIYRFISKDLNFIESHTGLEDVDIERQILNYCKRQHKKMRKKLWN